MRRNPEYPELRMFAQDRSEERHYTVLDVTDPHGIFLIATFRDSLIRDQCAEALAEIDELRESNTLLQAIIDDALPSVVITNTALMNIDGRWMRVLTDPEDL